jgi:16S rRNA (guanine527-N7)-methyltransferase
MLGMFHVKHRSPGSISHREGGLEEHPQNVASEACRLIETSLANLGFIPAKAGFIDRIGKFAATLALWGVRMNLTAQPRDPSEIAFHVIDSLMPLVIASCAEGSSIGEVFAKGTRVLDLGSGAGFPALVLAAACDADFTLIESRRKRASFLSTAAAAMELTNVSVEPARGEPARFTPIYDLVTARAFGRPALFHRSAVAALKRGGIALLYANPDQDLEIAKAREQGLGECTRFPYEVARGGKPVARIIAVWHRL